MAEHGTVRVKVAPLEAWTSTALPCSLCTRPMRLGSPVLAVSQSAAGTEEEWARHAHLIPSQCVAGGALALGSLDVDCSCDVCGEGVLPGVQLWGCRMCDYDACKACYATLPGQGAPLPAHPNAAKIKQMVEHIFGDEK